MSVMNGQEALRAAAARRGRWVVAFLCLTAVLGCAPAIKELPPDAPSPVPLENIKARDGGRIDVMPRLVRYTAPEYPQQAIFDGITGTIRLAASVDEAGRVTEVKALRSLPVFDIPCIEAMQAWRFSPALRGGRAVAFTVEVPFSFQIP
jgi:TonB family protein